MKLRPITKYLKYSFAGALLACMSAQANFGPDQNCCCDSGRIYLSLFGGFAQSNKVDLSQYATAFFREDTQGGPLAVDSFGQTDSRHAGLFGANVGYQWAALFPNQCNRTWSISPAVEWEGFVLGKTSFESTEVNNATDRLADHDFHVIYPIRTGVFLTNFVVNINSCYFGKFHPYVGIGLGSAVSRISNASSIQTAPPELTNHYNANPSDNDSTFAAQPKVGLRYDFCKNVGAFIEYRYLYMASSNFDFGSTVATTHVPTSNWVVRMDPQRYNSGTIGIRFSL